MVFLHTPCSALTTYESVGGDGAWTGIGCLVVCTLSLPRLLLLVAFLALACGDLAYLLLFLYVRVSLQWHAHIPFILLSAVLAASLCVTCLRLLLSVSVPV